MSFELSRREYSDLYGPTVGDAVRLADTELFAVVEKDLTVYGEEVVFGGGKVIRDGMGENGVLTRAHDIPDTVITNALIIDHTGIVKADVALRDGHILRIGKAGNPQISDGITITIGAATEIIAGEGRILTAGGIDTHIHFISAQQIDTALNSGVTTMIGGGTGPAAGTNATTVTPGPWHIARMLQALDGVPMNIGLLGKGHAGATEPLAEQIRAGAIGLKVHEDWGSTTASIDNSLRVADEYDVQVAIHTDTLNECGFLEDTVAAIDGRVIHTFHTEGAGGGHAPDIIAIAGHPNVLPASTNPTLPFTENTIVEHLDMLMVCHHLNADIPEDVAFADSRIRPETIAAEGVLHDMGIISITSSDSQAMGRVGEVITRTWQLADSMKRQRGPLDGDPDGGDNARIKRYVAKYTINPALAQGIAEYVGSVEEGKFADLVLWNPAFFGVKPDLVIKGGQIATALMGDANASIPTPQPRTMRPQFGSMGQAVHDAAITFLSTAAAESGVAGELGLRKRTLPVRGIRTLRKQDLPHNGATPDITVDPETYVVAVDGTPVRSEPASSLPMTQRYFLFGEARSDHRNRRRQPRRPRPRRTGRGARRAGAARRRRPREADPAGAHRPRPGDRAAPGRARRARRRSARRRHPAPRRPQHHRRAGAGDRRARDRPAHDHRDGPHRTRTRQPPPAGAVLRRRFRVRRRGDGGAVRPHRGGLPDPPRRALHAAGPRAAHALPPRGAHALNTVSVGESAGRDVQERCSIGAGASPGYLLPLLQLSDSALPTGAFSHSFGMESYLADGTITDEATFAAWLRAYVSRQLAYTDGLAIRMVFDALHLGDLDAVWNLDRLIAALTLPEQVRTAAATIGRRTAEVGTVVAPESFLGDYLAELDAGRCHGHPAVAFALLAHAVDAPPAAAIEAHLFAAVTSLTQNAVRAIPIGQTAGQRVQRSLHDVVADAVATAMTLTDEDLGAASPGLEIAQMRHRRQRARMFMS